MMNALFFSLVVTSFAKTVSVPGGVYTPLFKEPGETETQVVRLWVDETPVTNFEFSHFLKAHPQFRKENIKSVFADTGYLAHWKTENSFTATEKDQPVVHVSWFAARKYCAWKGKRLPTIAEWEYFSDSQNPETEKKILEWYSQPKSRLQPVGREAPNKYGLKDLQGQVWAWVDNFSETIMSGDSRGGSPTEAMFCGGSALKAKDPKLYATFLRFAFRSSLTAQYTSAKLGFRCVKESK